MDNYYRRGCSIVDSNGLVIYRDLVQFTDRALDRLVELLNTDAADEWADLLRIMEKEASAGQYVLYYRLDDDLAQVQYPRTLQAEENALARQLAHRVEHVLSPQTYAALQARPYWTHFSNGSILQLRLEFEGPWFLESQASGSWYLTYPDDRENFFLAYTDASLRESLLAVLADWRKRSKDDEN